MTLEVEQWIGSLSPYNRFRLFKITYDLWHMFSAPDLRSIHRGDEMRWSDEELAVINQPYKNFLESLVVDGHVLRDGWRYKINDQRESKLFFVEKIIEYARQLGMEIDEETEQ